MPEPISLPRLFHHRWSVPLIAELHRATGAKLVWIEHRLGAARRAVKLALGQLMRMELVMRNPGYGHPLRPEYLLTTRGMRIGPACTDLLDRLQRLGVDDVAQRKWAMPALAALGKSGRRYSEVRESLGGITDRALADALKCLQRADLASRFVLNTYPPATVYQPNNRAGPIIAALMEIERGLGPFPEAGRERAASRRARSA